MRLSVIFLIIKAKAVSLPLANEKVGEKYSAESSDPLFGDC